MADTDSKAPAKFKPTRAKRNKAPAGKRALKAAKPISKSEIVVKLLARRNGATVAEMSAATGWQAHSVRAFFSGLRRKCMPLMRVSRVDGASCYRLVSANGPEAEYHALVVGPVDAPVVASVEVPGVAFADDTKAGA